MEMLFDISDVVIYPDPDFTKFIHKTLQSSPST